MSAPWYVPSGAPSTNASLDSATVRAEFVLVETALDQLPAFSGNGGKLVLINAGATAMETLALTTAGAILIGDGATTPTTLAAFTSATGTLKHEYGGIEADISAIADGGILVGTGAGTMAIRAGVLTGGASGFLKHELGGLEFNLSAVVDGDVPVGTGAGTMGLESGATFRATVGLAIGTNVQAYDATLTSIAALGTAADKICYTTAIDTWAETALTSAARTVLDDTTVEAMVDTLGGATSSGTGGLVRITNASLITPTLGVASATSLATSAATPLLLTNGQLVNIALTSQTVGATTLTIPNFASVVDEFTFKTKAQTLSNKTFVAPILGAATGTSLQAIIGNVTPQAGTFTTLTSTGNTTLGNNAADVFTANTDKIVSSLAGGINLPLQSSFSAFLSSEQANVTGNTTVYLVICDTEIKDQNADYNNATGVFTAPVLGQYPFCAGAYVNDRTIATSARLRLVTSNRTYYLDVNITTATNKNAFLSGFKDADMDAGDTAYIDVTGYGEAGDTNDILGDATTIYTYFSGYLAY